MKKAILFIISTGWLVPLWGHFSVLHSWHTSEVIPKLNGIPQINTFPQYQISQQLLVAAGIWFSLVVVCFVGYSIFKGSANGNS